MKSFSLGKSVGALGIFFSSAISSEQDNTYIKEVQVRDNGVVIVITSSERVIGTESCVNGDYHKTHWAFNPSTTSRYGDVLATILSAKSMTSLVKISGTGACDAFATIETLQSITIK